MEIVYSIGSSVWGIVYTKQKKIECMCVWRRDECMILYTSRSYIEHEYIVESSRATCASTVEEVPP